MVLRSIVIVLFKVHWPHCLSASWSRLSLSPYLSLASHDALCHLFSYLKKIGDKAFIITCNFLPQSVLAWKWLLLSSDHWCIYMSQNIQFRPTAFPARHFLLELCKNQNFVPRQFWKEWRLSDIQNQKYALVPRKLFFTKLKNLQHADSYQVSKQHW